MNAGTIRKPLVKWILAPLLALSLCVPSWNMTAFGATNDNSIENNKMEVLGYGNQSWESRNSWKAQTKSVPTIELGTYGDTATNNAPRNYTAVTDGDTQIYQTIDWNGDVGAENEKKATLTTYVKSKKGKMGRAVYIFSTCSSHGFSWQTAAEGQPSVVSY